MSLRSRGGGFEPVITYVLIELFPIAVAGLLTIGYMLARRASSGGWFHFVQRAQAGGQGSHEGGSY